MQRLQLRGYVLFLLLSSLWPSGVSAFDFRAQEQKGARPPKEAALLKLHRLRVHVHNQVAVSRHRWQV
ncbi:MAG: hypothetical protein ACPGUV_09025, partial [Polyangiales bacterium]